MKIPKCRDCGFRDAVVKIKECGAGSANFTHCLTCHLKVEATQEPRKPFMQTRDAEAYGYAFDIVQAAFDREVKPWEYTKGLPPKVEADLCPRTLQCFIVLPDGSETEFTHINLIASRAHVSIEAAEVGKKLGIMARHLA